MAKQLCKGYNNQAHILVFQTTNRKLHLPTITGMKRRQDCLVEFQNKQGRRQRGSLVFMYEKQRSEVKKRKKGRYLWLPTISSLLIRIIFLKEPCLNSISPLSFILHVCLTLPCEERQVKNGEELPISLIDHCKRRRSDSMETGFPRLLPLQLFLK